MRFKGVVYPIWANKENPPNLLCFNQKKIKKYCKKFEKLFANSKIITIFVSRKTTKNKDMKTMDRMQVLTVDKARSLVGKAIRWTYIGYKFNEQLYETTLIGGIVKESDWAKSQPCEGYSSRWEYWKKVLPKTAERAENTLLLLDDNGETTCIKAYCGKYDIFGYPEPTFTCSDADREVYFKILQ